MTFTPHIQQAIEEITDQINFYSTQLAVVTESFENVSWELRNNPNPPSDIGCRMEGLGARITELSALIHDHTKWQETLSQILNEILEDEPPSNP